MSNIWMNLALGLADALAWPILAFTLALMFRESIRKLIPRIKGIRYKDWEVDLSVKLEKSKVQVGTKWPSRKPLSIDESILSIAAISPKTAIRESWNMIEDALLDLAERGSVPMTFSMSKSYRAVNQALVEASLIDNDVATMANEMRYIRDMIMDRTDLVPSSCIVQTYVELATRIKAALQETLT